MIFLVKHIDVLIILSSLVWVYQNYSSWNIRLALPQHLKKKFGIKFTLKLFLCLLGLAGWFYLYLSVKQTDKVQKVAARNVYANDIYIVFDISKSMDAVDFNPDRFTVAKQQVKNFIRYRIEDRIGVIFFAEKIMTLIPLTFDRKLILSSLDEIKVGDLGQGTNIGDALSVAVSRLKNSKAQNKVIILLTDGVSQVDTITPLSSANYAKQENIKIFTVGIGASQDAKLPIYSYNGVTHFQTIPGGSLDFKILKEIADLTGGQFYLASNENTFNDIFEEIKNLSKSFFKVEKQNIYTNDFYHFLLIGIILILASDLLKFVFLRRIK